MNTEPRVITSLAELDAVIAAAQNQTDGEIKNGIMQQFADATNVEFAAQSVVVTFPERFVVVRRIDWQFDFANGNGHAFLSHREAVHYAQTGQELRGCHVPEIVRERENTPLVVLFAEQENQLAQERVEAAQANKLWSALGPLDADD